MAAISRTVKRIVTLFAVLIVTAAIALTLTTLGKNKETNAIDNFEECAAAGHPIMESYPERCAVPGGSTYTKQY